MGSGAAPVEHCRRHDELQTLAMAKTNAETRARTLFPLPWLTAIMVLAATLVTLWSMAIVGGSGLQYVFSVFGYYGHLDGWTVLWTVAVVLGVGGVAGSWLSLGRRAYRWMALFLLIQLPMPFLIEANRCDVMPMCEATRWALLPRWFLTWRISTGRASTAPDTSTSVTAVPSPPHLSRRLTVFPATAHVPESFLAQAKTSDLGGHSRCFLRDVGDDAPCEVYVLDIYGDGAPAVLAGSPEDRNDHQLAAEIFRRRSDGAWAKSGEIVVTCADSMKALREGRFAYATPKAHDIVLSGRQFNLLTDPDYVCPASTDEKPH
jgi:hypothetical protein